jgi:hypothetical protein
MDIKYLLCADADPQDRPVPRLVPVKRKPLCIGNGGKCPYPVDKNRYCRECAIRERPEALRLEDAIRQSDGEVIRDGFRYRLSKAGLAVRICVGSRNTCTKLATSRGLCYRHNNECAVVLPPNQSFTLNGSVKFVVKDGTTRRACAMKDCNEALYGHNKYCKEHR